MKVVRCCACGRETEVRKDETATEAAERHDDQFAVEHARRQRSFYEANPGLEDGDADSYDWT